MQIKKDFISIFSKIEKRVELAKDIKNTCESLQIESEEVIVETVKIFSEMENNVGNESKVAELTQAFEVIGKKYPHFQNAIINFLHATNKGNSTLNKMVPMDLNILKVELDKVTPRNVNSLLQYFDFKIRWFA